MPIGTAVVASRAGVVVLVQEDFHDWDNAPGHESMIFVRHDDAAIARYIHLTNMGALVQWGEQVGAASSATDLSCGLSHLTSYRAM